MILMAEYVSEKIVIRKKNNGCIIALVMLLLFFGFMLYAMIDFRNMIHKDWKRFDDERIAKVEKYLDMTIPDEVTPVRFKWYSAPGDGTCFNKLIVEGISDPNDFIDKAFSGADIKEITPDNERFSGICNTLYEVSEDLDLSIEFSDVYERVSTKKDERIDKYYIGFSKTDSGYCAVITCLNDY